MASGTLQTSAGDKTATAAPLGVKGGAPSRWPFPHLWPLPPPHPAPPRVQQGEATATPQRGASERQVALHATTAAWYGSQRDVSRSILRPVRLQIGSGPDRF